MNPWVKLALAAGTVYAASKVFGGPNKRPSVDGKQVGLNGNGPVQEPGNKKQPAYCGVESLAC